MESLVKLTVKTPNQGIDDIQINCQLDWTVRKLKEYLQDVYPSNPASSSQRLIYLGRLLQDHHSLKEVFGEWGARTLHIVCNDNTETMATTTSTVANTTTSTAPATNTPGMDGLRFRGYASPQELPSNQPFMGASTMPSMFPQYAPAMSNTPIQSTQFHQMQTQLAQQYQQQMQQYYQQWHQWQQTMGGEQWPYNQYAPNMSAALPNIPLTASPVPTLSPQQIPHQHQQQPQQQQQPGQQQQQQQQQGQPEVVPNQPDRNVRMNAGPGGVGMQEDDDDNENPRNRDWLDRLYTSLRAFMLLSIVYFYSSTSRFIMVTILAFLLYLYQNGWFTPRRVPIPEPVEEPPLNIADERIDEQDDINGHQHNAEQAGDNSDINTTDQTPIIPIGPPRPNPIRMICTFFVSFVTSLIPNPPAIPQQ